MIRSKFKLFVYLYFFLSVCIFAGCIYLFSHPELRIKGKSGISFPAPVTGLLMLIPGILLFVTIAKKALTIIITNESISIKGFFMRKTIHQTDIKSINLISMQDLYLVVGVTTISSIIELENGEKIILADPFYKNISALKNSLVTNFAQKIKPFNFSRNPSSTASDSETDFQKFIGNPYFNFNTILFFGLTIFFLALILTKPISSNYLLLIIPLIIFYFGLGTQQYFFLISNKRIIIRNHFLPWVNKTYYMNEIIAINFESPYRRSEALRITTRDFNSKSYCAGSLKQKDWNSLKEKLRSLEINVLG
jgi:hypothetical protein